MWNSKKYAAIAIAGAGFAVQAASPASACFAWGHSGIYSYGWAYANTGVSNSPAYSYRSCGGTYEIQNWFPLPPLVVTVPVTDAGAPIGRVSRASRGRSDGRRAQSVGR